MPDLLLTISRYLAAVLDDGDYLNDWLTHLYDPAATMLAYLGMAVARVYGC